MMAAHSLGRGDGISPFYDPQKGVLFAWEIGDVYVYIYRERVCVCVQTNVLISLKHFFPNFCDATWACLAVHS